MTEKVLDYNRAIVPQETYYWCGPAATQIVLNARGIQVAESVLASSIGTTVNGTDYVGLIERELDRRVPSAKFTTVYTPSDPMTASQKSKLWADIVASINAGWGVVANIVAPPSNYPRGVKGSTSPAYAGGTVFHYIALMGYDDVARAVWVADSGFRPFGYWIGFDQLASLIPPKGYCYAAAEPVVVPNMIDAEAKVAASWIGKRITEGERIVGADKRGRAADFENGSIYFHPATGAMAIPSAILRSWLIYGGVDGSLGYPTRRHTVVDGGDIQAFQGGILYRQRGSAEAYPVRGVIGQRWIAEGYETGPLGWPISDEYPVDEVGRRQDFEHGRLEWHPSGAVKEVKA